MEISDPLVLKIICSTQLHSQLQHICTTHDVLLNVQSNIITLTLNSIWGDLEAAEKDMLSLMHAVTQSITMEPLILQSCNIPLLVSDTAISELHKIDEQFGVDISVITTSGDILPFSEFVDTITSLIRPASDPDSLLMLSQVSRFAEMKLSRNWRYQDASGQMKSFPPAIKSLLDENFLPFRRGVVHFTLDSIRYGVDFSRMVLLQDGSENSGKIDNEPPMWTYSEGPTPSDSGSMTGSKYTRSFDLVTSQEIDLAVQYGVPGLLTLGESQVSFDVLSRPVVLHDVSKGCKWLLHRNPPLPDEPDCVITLAIRCRSEHRPHIELALKTLLKRQLVTQIYKIPPATTIPLQCLLIHMTRQYCVKSYLVADVDTSLLEIRIQGEKDYVCAVKMNMLEVFLQTIVPLCIERPLAIPHTWKPHQNTDIETVSVPSGGKEWNKLEVLLKKSLKSVKLVGIIRIQNLTLWRRYSFFKSLMSRRNGDSQLNEKYLFHGTRKTDPMTIISSEKGFDFRYGSDDCLWGKGMYFAVDASYCDSRFVYVTSQGMKQLFVASILTGRSINIRKPNRTLKEPPRLPNSTETYDSVNGTVENPTHTNVYVIYDHDKAYPAYLLTYRN